MAEGNKYYQQLLNDDLVTPKNNDTKKLFITYFDNSKGIFFFESNDAFHTQKISHLWSLTFMVQRPKKTCM